MAARPFRPLDAPGGAETLKPEASGQLAPTPNPLLKAERIRTVDLDRIEGPPTIRRPRQSGRRDIRDLRRRQSATDAVAGLDQSIEIYGFTKGQFSLLDLLRALLQVTGPAHLSLSTWTAARHEIQALRDLADAGQLLSMRWLVDFTFARRDPEAAYSIRQTFGLETIRVCQNHAKFATFTNETWKLVLRTSMNLNMNPRFEDFTVAHDPQLCDFLTELLDGIWKQQDRRLAEAAAKEIRQAFREM